MDGSLTERGAEGQAEELIGPRPDVEPGLAVQRPQVREPVKVAVYAPEAVFEALERDVIEDYVTGTIVLDAVGSSVISPTIRDAIREGGGRGAHCPEVDIGQVETLGAVVVGRVSAVAVVRPQLEQRTRAVEFDRGSTVGGPIPALPLDGEPAETAAHRGIRPPGAGGQDQSCGTIQRSLRKGDSHRYTQVSDAVIRGAVVPGIHQDGPRHQRGDRPVRILRQLERDGSADDRQL